MTSIRTRNIGASFEWIVLSFLVLLSSSRGSEGETMNKTTLRLDEIRSIYENRQLTDAEAVWRLTNQLDQRITLMQESQSGLAGASRDIAMLIGLIAERPYPSRPKGRPDAIRAALERVETLQNEAEARKYLQLALGLAGERVPESVLLDALDSTSNSEQLVLVALRAMNRSRVPIRVLPALLRLSDHPWHYTDSPMDVGPQNPRTVYPIREAVAESLRKLQIETIAITVDANPSDSQSAGRTRTLLSVSKRSLLEQIGGWIGSADPEIWKPAIAVASELPNGSVLRLISDRLRTESLPVEKREALADVQKLLARRLATAESSNPGKDHGTNDKHDD